MGAVRDPVGTAHGDLTTHGQPTVLYQVSAAPTDSFVGEMAGARESLM